MRDESRVRRDARDESRTRKVVDDGRNARMGDGFQMGGPTEEEMRMFKMMIMARNVMVDNDGDRLAKEVPQCRHGADMEICRKYIRNLEADMRDLNSPRG